MDNVYNRQKKVSQINLISSLYIKSLLGVNKDCLQISLPTLEIIKKE